MLRSDTDIILRDRDNTGCGESCDPWLEESDGVLEERRFYCQNWRADVVAVTKSDGTPLEYVRYSAYGEATVYPVADLNMDGVVDSADLTEWSNLVYGNPSSAVYADSDIDFDGADNWASSDTDYNLFAESYAANVGLSGKGRVSSVGVGNRIGYAGYQWDGTLGGYHVRYRVYLPEIGRWTRRDPIGYADGASLYEYARLSALRYLDPMGLAPPMVVPGPEWPSPVPYPYPEAPGIDDPSPLLPTPPATPARPVTRPVPSPRPVQPAPPLLDPGAWNPWGPGERSPEAPGYAPPGLWTNPAGMLVRCHDHISDLSRKFSPRWESPVDAPPKGAECGGILTIVWQWVRTCGSTSAPISAPVTDVIHIDHGVWDGAFCRATWWYSSKYPRPDNLENLIPTYGALQTAVGITTTGIGVAGCAAPTQAPIDPPDRTPPAQGPR